MILSKKELKLKMLRDSLVKEYSDVNGKKIFVNVNGDAYYSDEYKLSKIAKQKKITKKMSI